MAVKNLIQIQPNSLQHDLDREGLKPLHHAAAANAVEVVELLLELKADVNSLTYKRQQTPLLLACRNGHSHVVELLLQRNALVNLADRQEWAPLHVASAQGHVDCVKVLLRHQADVDLVHAPEGTPLHLACAGGYRWVVDVLISGGADLFVVNGHGRLPVEVCTGQASMAAFVQRKMDQKTEEENAPPPEPAAPEPGPASPITSPVKSRRAAPTRQKTPAALPPASATESPPVSTSGEASPGKARKKKKLSPFPFAPPSTPAPPPPVPVAEGEGEQEMNKAPSFAYPPPSSPPPPPPPTPDALPPSSPRSSPETQLVLDECMLSIELGGSSDESYASDEEADSYTTLSSRSTELPESPSEEFVPPHHALYSPLTPEDRLLVRDCQEVTEWFETAQQRGQPKVISRFYESVIPKCVVLQENLNQREQLAAPTEQDKHFIEQATRVLRQMRRSIAHCEENFGEFLPVVEGAQDIQDEPSDSGEWYSE